LCAVNSALVVLGPGCATRDEQSYNENFNQNLPTAPKYVIEDQDDSRFKIRIHQGSPMEMDPARVTYLKQATTVVAQDEARRRGWSNWDVDYIQERDKGWMHVLVAEVTEKPAITTTTTTAPLIVVPTPPPDVPPPPPPSNP